MMDVSLICKKIYKAVYIVVLTDGSLAPVAYIHLTAGKNAAEQKQALQQEFNRLKWNTPLSTADLEIKIDDSLMDDTVKIDGVEEFFDDETGMAKKYPVLADDALVNC